MLCIENETKTLDLALCWSFSKRVFFLYIEFKNISKMNHKSMQVRCSLDEPLQLLMDKLASKSSDLYIFWQNYNQLYHAYNDKATELQRLQQENELLRKEQGGGKPSAPVPEQSFYKERCQYMERSVEDFKAEMQRLQLESKELKKENQKYQEENFQLQTLLQQLRNQNAIQRKHIEKILEQLKQAQNEINAMTKVYQELGQKEIVLSRYATKEKEMIDRIEELEAELEDKNEQSRVDKVTYEKLIRQSMMNAKNKVIESLPGLLQTSKHRVQIVNP